jgi:hypothetical protein
LCYKGNRNKGEEDAGHYEEGDGCVCERGKQIRARIERKADTSSAGVNENEDNTVVPRRFIPVCE